MISSQLGTEARRRSLRRRWRPVSLSSGPSAVVDGSGPRSSPTARARASTSSPAVGGTSAIGSGVGSKSSCSPSGVVARERGSSVTGSDPGSVACSPPGGRLRLRACRHRPHHGLHPTLRLVGLGLDRQRWLVADQATCGVVVRDHVAAGHVVQERRGLAAARGRHRHRPAAVVASPRVPAGTGRVEPAGAQVLVDGVAEQPPRSRRVLAAQPAATRLLADVLALGEHRYGVRHDPLDRHLRDGGDRLG